MGNVNEVVTVEENGPTTINDAKHPQLLAQSHPPDISTLKNNPILQGQTPDAKVPPCLPPLPSPSHHLQRNTPPTPKICSPATKNYVPSDAPAELMSLSRYNTSNGPSDASFPIIESNVLECFDGSEGLSPAGESVYFIANDGTDMPDIAHHTATPGIAAIAHSMARVSLTQEAGSSFWSLPKHVPVRISLPPSRDTSIALPTEGKERILIDVTSKPLPSTVVPASVQTSTRLLDKDTPKPSTTAKEPIKIPLSSTYADATNLAARFPELASEILVQPLYRKSDAEEGAVLSSRSSIPPANMQLPPIPFAMPAHTSDRPNWALAPDPDPVPSVELLTAPSRYANQNSRENCNPEVRDGRENQHRQGRANRNGNRNDKPRRSRKSDIGTSVPDDHQPGRPKRMRRGTHEQPRSQPQHREQGYGDQHDEPPHFRTVSPQYRSDLLSSPAPRDNKANVDPGQSAHGPRVLESNENGDSQSQSSLPQPQHLPPALATSRTNSLNTSAPVDISKSVSDQRQPAPDPWLQDKINDTPRQSRPEPQLQVYNVSDHPSRLLTAPVLDRADSLNASAPFGEPVVNKLQPFHDPRVTEGNISLLPPSSQTSHICHDPLSHLPATVVTSSRPTNLPARPDSVNEPQQCHDLRVSVDERGRNHDVSQEIGRPSFDPPRNKNETLDANELFQNATVAQRYPDPRSSPGKASSGGTDSRVRVESGTSASWPTTSLISGPDAISEQAFHATRHNNDTSSNEKPLRDTSADATLLTWRRTSAGNSSPKYIPPPVARSRGVSPTSLLNNGSNASKLDHAPSRENSPFHDILLRTNNSPHSKNPMQDNSDSRGINFDVILNVRPPSQSGVAALAAAKASAILDDSSVHNRQDQNNGSSGDTLPFEINNRTTDWFTKPAQDAFPPKQNSAESKPLNAHEAYTDPLSGVRPQQDLGPYNVRSCTDTPLFEFYCQLPTATVNLGPGIGTFDHETIYSTDKSRPGRSVSLSQPDPRRSTQVCGGPGGFMTGGKQEGPSSKVFIFGDPSLASRSDETASRKHEESKIISQFLDSKRRRSLPQAQGSLQGRMRGNREAVHSTLGSRAPKNGTGNQDQSYGPPDKVVGSKRSEGLGTGQTTIPGRSTSHGTKEFISPLPCSELDGGKQVSGGNGKASASGWV